jgi:hypothetical protein
MKKEKMHELEKSGVKLPRRVVQRQIIKEIVPWLKRDEIIVITGARQTGKSVLLYQLIFDYLLPRTDNVYYFNLDVPGHLRFFDDPDRLIRLIEKNKGRSFVLIDEIQRLKEPGLFLKGIYDLHLPVKIIVSGSSALEIKSHVHEALTGRKVIFSLNPFNLNELSDALFPKGGKSFDKVLEHYLIFGGYPAVALAKENKLKLNLLKEIFTSYLEKDVKSFLKIENESAFRNLVKLLASQVGSLVNKEELSNTLGIHKNTLDTYLFYLEQTFILDFLRPFFKNPRKELLKNPKVYFRDPGIRNFALGAFGEFEFRADKGSLFENFVYLCLKEMPGSSAPIYFWRTKTGAEVDFVLLKGLKPVPIEVKAIKLKEPKVSKSFRSFLLTYRPPRAFCVNLSYQGIRRIENTEVSFLTPAGLATDRKIAAQG